MSIKSGCAANEVRKQVRYLLNEAAWLRATWHVWCQLALEGEIIDDDLTKAAPVFFGIAERAIRRDVAHALCRLDDRAKKALSITDVLKSLDFSKRSDLGDRVRTAMKTLEDVMPRIRRIRDEILAHANLQVAVGNAPSARTTPETVSQAVDAAVECVKAMAEAAEIPDSGIDLGIQTDLERLAVAVRIPSPHHSAGSHR
jgi:hypothetical protein